MNIAIIGTGNVGGALATKWSEAGHNIYLGVRDPDNFNRQVLLTNQNTGVHHIQEAVKLSEVILMATPARVAIEVAKGLGNTEGKTIIDAMNIVMGQGPESFSNTSEAILANTASREVVKCFNTTGYNNMIDPNYEGTALDMFVCGDSQTAKRKAIQLSKDAGFEQCYDVGGNDKFLLMEQFAFFWINLALFRGQGREIGFKLLKR